MKHEILKQNPLYLFDFTSETTEKYFLKIGKKPNRAFFVVKYVWEILFMGGKEWKNGSVTYIRSYTRYVNRERMPYVMT